MNNTFTLILAVLFSGLLIWVAPDPAQAVTSTGPYYAPPSWDQKLPAENRFVVLSDWENNVVRGEGGAILDRETGLVWERLPDIDPTRYFNASFLCANKSVGDRRGWRLPSFPELASLVDSGSSNPALPTGHPFRNVQSEGYWSATTLAGDPTSAWVVSFLNGGVVFAEDKDDARFRGWCVRGGMNADQY